MASKKKRTDAEQAAAPDETPAPAEELREEPVEELDGEAGDEAAPGYEAGEAAAPSAEDLLRAERDDFQDRWLRTAAELENFRKRSRREVEDARRFAVADLLRALLEVLDDLDRALKAAGDDEGGRPEGDGLRRGVELIHQRFAGVLRDCGVSRIEAEAAEFDPAVHEAIQQVEQEGVASGTVVGVVQEGYRLHDLVLRPSRVIVAK